MSNLKALPVTGLINSNADVVEWLRTIANNIENGEWGDVKSSLLVVEYNGVIDTYTAGVPGLDNTRVVGMLEVAKCNFVADMRTEV